MSLIPGLIVSHYSLYRDVKENCSDRGDLEDMMVLKCEGCNRKLLTYDNTSFRRYESPVKKCKKCGKVYVDPRCHEIAIEGVPSDVFSVKAYIFLMIFGGFILYRGLHISKMTQLGISQQAQWVMPMALIIGGVVCMIGAIIEMIAIVTGIKARKYERLAVASQQRLSNKNYAYMLKNLGYQVPEKYFR